MGRYSLIIVASLFLLLAFFVIAMVNTGEASLHRNIRTLQYNNARNVANSASQLIINNIINHRENWYFGSASDGVVSNHPLQNFTAWEELNGEYKISTITKDGIDLQVTVTGKADDREYDINVQFRKIEEKAGMFDFAAYSQDDFTIGNQGVIDSFHPSNPGVNTNNAVVGYGSNGQFTNNGTLHGKAVREDRQMTPATDPGGGDVIPGISNNHQFDGGEWRIDGDISLSGNRVITVTDTTVLYIDGGIYTSGNSEIIIEEGAKLTIYLNGELDTQGNGLVNDTGYAKNLIIYGTEQANMTIDLQGSNNSVFRGAIYAPESNIVVRGGNNFTVYGALVGKTVEVYRNLVYDESLADFEGEDLVAISRYAVVIWE